METKQIPQMRLAVGPDGLRKTLWDLFDEIQANPDLQAQKQFISYRIGELVAILQFDFNHDPIQVRYNDLDGRPAPKSVKEIIADFVWEKFPSIKYYLNYPDDLLDARQQILQTVYKETYDSQRRVEETLMNISGPPRKDLPSALHELEQLDPKKTSAISVTSNMTLFGSANKKPEKASVATEEVSPGNRRKT